ncbi:SPDY domain-containing protein [Streptomyces sp. SD15]
MPRVLLDSPDQKALLRLEPDLDGRWWTLSHAAEPDKPAWYASFGARTPVELIAAVTDALTDPAPAADAPTDPYEPLQQSGWMPDSADNALVSPDRIAYVQRLGSAEEPGAWFVTSTLGLDRPVWQARFGAHTPAHLVAAFTRALADPKPLHRPDSGRSLPTLDPNVVTRRATNVLAVYVAGALEQRVHSLADRHTTAPTVAIPSRQAPPRHSRSR